MIRSGFYLKGLLSVRSVDSPAIALGCSFLAIGAFLKNIGFKGRIVKTLPKLKIEKI